MSEPLHEKRICDITDKHTLWKTSYREFLNSHPSKMAAVSIDATVTTEQNKEVFYTWANLSISDCRKTVVLEFEYTNEEGRAEALEKVNRLRAAIDTLEEALWLRPDQEVTFAPEDE